MPSKDAIPLPRLFTISAARLPSSSRLLSSRLSLCLSIPCLQSRRIDVRIQALGSWWEVATLLVGLAFVARQLDVHSRKKANGVVWWWVLDRVTVGVLQLQLEVAHALVLREVPLEDFLLSVETTVHIPSWLCVWVLLAGRKLCVRVRRVVPADGAYGSCLVVGVREVDCYWC